MARATLDLTHLRLGRQIGLWVFGIANHAESNPHDHLFHELVYVESGSADHLTAAGTQRLRPGDLIVIGPQAWHGYRHTRRLSIINCLFDSRYLHRLGPLLSDAQGALDLFVRRPRRPREQAPVVLHARPAQRQQLLSRFQQIMLEQREQRPGWRTACAAALLDILLATVRLSHASDPAATLSVAQRSEQAVLDCVTYLESHYSEPVHLPTLAQLVHLSPAHLSRSFARRMGMGVVEFVHRLRLEEACRLLTLSDDAVKSIAARVGYNEIAYFSRIFRRQLGQSPRSYRRLQRTGYEIHRTNQPKPRRSP